jgi:trimethylamine--corrinoid protein Co-methyltransferase
MSEQVIPSSRRGRHRRERATAIPQRPWRRVRNPFPPLQAVSADELESIHDASLRVLEEIGIDFLLPEAREIMKAQGAEVTAGADRVRMDRGLVAELVAKAPAQFPIHARNPHHTITMGGNETAFCAIGSAPNVSDMEGGRRTGNNADYRNLLRLAQVFNAIHLIGGYPVEPVDIHPSIRHLDALRDMAVLTDKPFAAYSLGRERNLDGLEIARIALGLSESELDETPCLFTIINTSSPLRIDAPMLRGCIEMARRNQIVCITPFTLAGAMAPVTVAGALVEQNAEALAGIAFCQAVRPGAPTIYGGFTSNVDMKSGAPAFGTPEYMKAALVGGQLARRYNLPYRSSNTCAANTVDAQAAYESVFSLWGAIMGGVNMLKHGAGWMEGGLCVSYEKFALDVDLLQMVAEFLQPLEITEDSLAVEAIREVGAGGHFFGTAHTQDRYRDAFYSPLISDWRNYRAWAEAGSPDAMRHANTLYKRALAEYEEPPIDPAIREELDDFVARRKAEGGVPTDF